MRTASSGRQRRPDTIRTEPASRQLEPHTPGVVGTAVVVVVVVVLVVVAAVGSGVVGLVVRTSPGAVGFGGGLGQPVNFGLGRSVIFFRNEHEGR